MYAVSSVGPKPRGKRAKKALERGRREMRGARPRLVRLRLNDHIVILRHHDLEIELLTNGGVKPE